MRLKHVLIPVLAVLACLAFPTVEAAQYTYDQLGRLTSVIESDGSSITYTYDANGNITSITRNSATMPLSVMSFLPASGPVGTSVTIRGTGFNPVAAQNTVKFNGVSATVSSANASTLVATVPASATSGPISVTTAGNTATSSSSFTVTTVQISGFTPTAGLPGTQVVIDGIGFDQVPGNNVVKFNTTTATVSAATTTQLTVAVPTGATSGRVSVTSPTGSAASTSDFIVPPANFSSTSIAMAGRLVPAGPGLVFTVNTTEAIAMALFDGVQGQRLSLAFTNVSMSGYFWIYAPDGTLLMWSGMASGLTSLDLGPFTQGGTYTLVMKPTVHAGSATVRAVPELLATLQTDGTALPVALVPAQNASLSFNGIAGESYSFVATNYISTPVGYSMVGSILRPDGTVLNACSTGVIEGFDGCHFSIPETGTYTVRLDPYYLEATSFDARLNTDFRATLIPGSPVDIVLDKRGRNALLTFDVASGQNVTLNLGSIVANPANKQLQLRVYNPAGTQIQSQWSTSANNTLNMVGLAAGTYTALVVADDAATASFTARIATTTPAPVSSNGVTVNVAATLPSQTLYLTFAGTQGQNLSLGLTNVVFASGATGYPWIQVLRPDGTQVTTANCGTNPGRCQIPIRNLPVTGTYRIEVLTSVVEATSLSATLSPSVTGTMTIGTPSTVNFTYTGQNALLTFTNPTSQTLTLNAGSFSLSPAGSTLMIRVFNASGTQISYGSGSTAVSVSLPTLAAGTYTVQVDPVTAATGSMQLNLSSGTPVPVDGTAVPFTASSAGEKGFFSFSASAGQNIGLGLTNLSLTPSSPNYVYVKVMRPDNSQFTAAYCYMSFTGCQLALRGLPTTGTYRIEVEPGTTQSMSFNLRLSPASGALVTPSNTPIPVSFDVPGSFAEYTFAATAGQVVTLRLASPSMTPTNSEIILRVFNPSGTQVTYTTVTTNGSTTNLPNLVAGTYSVSITPTYAATGSVQFTLAAGLTGTLPTDGTSSSYTSSVAGQNAYLTFSATAGQSLGLGITNLSLSSGSQTYVYLQVFKPDNSYLTAASCYTSFTGCQLDLRNLPATGTYRVQVDPGTQQTMSFTATLSQNVGGAITPSDTPIPVSFGVPGQSAQYTFTATAGQNLAIRLASLALTPANSNVRLAVYNPSGGMITYSDVTTNPTTINLANLGAGTHTVTVVPIYAATGSAALTIAPGLTGSLTSNGTGTSYSTTVAGQKAYITFAATAGENLGLGLTGLTLSTGSPTYVYVKVMKPDNSQFTAVYCYTSYTGCQIALQNLPTTGTYRIEVEPGTQQTTSFTLTLSQAVAGTLSSGTPLPLNLTSAGQMAVITFTATAGQSVPVTMNSLAMTPAGSTVYLYAYNPAGNMITYTTATTSAVTLNLNNLAAGTYTLVVAPYYAATGSLQLSRP